MADREAARAEAVWNDAVDGRLPDTPDRLREALATSGASAPLNTLRALVDAVRVREREARTATARHGMARACEVPCTRRSPCAAAAWRSTTCARASRKRTARLPASFLAALHVLGDASCLEPLAAAWAAADGGQDRGRRSAGASSWRRRSSAIAQREKITQAARGNEADRGAMAGDV